MSAQTFLVGTGVQSIYACSLTSDGQIQLIGETKCGKGSTWLLDHHDLLYVVNEHDDQIEVFSIDDREKGELTLKQRVPCQGNTPCSLAIDRTEKWLTVANYGHQGTSNIVVFPFDSMKQIDGEAARIVSIDGNGPNRDRQDHSHCHHVVFNGQYLYVADLGTDTLSVYRFDPNQGELELHGDRIRTDAGAGPRHLIFHPDQPLIFVANELDSTVYVYRVDTSAGQLTFLEKHSTRREDDRQDSTKENFPAEIQISPDHRFLLVSNRGDENLVIFQINDGNDRILTLKQHLDCRGSFTRFFDFDPTGKFLLVANQKTNNLLCFGYDHETGEFLFKSQLENIESPQHLIFLRR